MSILDHVASTLKSVFLSRAEAINRTIGVVKRKRKFSAATLAQAFIMAFAKNPNASHQDVSCMAIACGVEVSPQAIEQRYTPQLRSFFQALFEDMVQHAVASDKPLAALLERFVEVILIDSSTITLPDSEQENYRGCGGSYGGGTAALKLQTEFDLRGGRLKCVEIEPGRSPDGASDRQHIEHTRGSLRIADLGYFNVSVFRDIDTAGAYFLSRVQHHVKIYVDGIKHDLVPWLNTQESGVVDVTIELGAEERFGCRLIAYRVPEEIANRRRQKLKATVKKKTGGQPSAAALAACDWEFMVTNMDATQTTVKEAIVLYRSRWQIELLFKRWKSDGLIGQLEGGTDVVKMCKFWIRLCAAVLRHWVTITAVWSTSDCLSLDKASRLLCDFVRELACKLPQLREPTGVAEVVSVLQSFCRTVRIACKQNKRRKKPSTLSLLRAPELLEYVLT